MFVGGSHRRGHSSVEVNGWIMLDGIPKCRSPIWLQYAFYLVEAGCDINVMQQIGSVNDVEGFIFKLRKVVRRRDDRIDRHAMEVCHFPDDFQHAGG